MSKNLFNYNFNSDKSPDGKTGYQREWSDIKRSNRNKKLRRLFIFLGIAATAAIITFYINWTSYNTKLSEAILEMQHSTPIPTENVPTPAPTPVDYDELPASLASAYRSNKDTIGYLQIDNTNIDLPVLRGEDNYFYQNRAQNKESNLHGCVYMLTECDPAKTRHLVVNGPDMEDGTMFADLKEFLNEGFFYNHQYITFYTLDGKTNWQVFSVHFANSEFNYSDVDFDDNIEYLAYINVFKTMSKFETNATLEPKDQILTLATSYYNNEDGYLLVHAKLIN